MRLSSACVGKLALVFRHCDLVNKNGVIVAGRLGKRNRLNWLAVHIVMKSMPSVWLNDARKPFFSLLEKINRINKNFQVNEVA